MSIIYNALQKAQQTREIEAEQAPAEYLKKNNHWLDIILIGTIFILFTIVIIAYAPKWKKYFVFKPKVALQPVPKNVIAYKNDLKLSGVFFSGSEAVALINNQMFHLGDTVSGMKIVAMDLNSVELVNGSQQLVLRLG